MSTYSTNFGNPAIEATNWNSLQKIMEGMPNNTAQLITPQHVRDAVYTTWEQGVFKILEAGTINYIGTDNGGSTNNFRYKMFLGKRELGLGNNIMDNALLSSDTDIFFYNNKSDSNPSLQDTKISFLAGSDFTLFQNAPYLEASKSLNSIDLSIINPSSGGGIISIDSDFIELGSDGWNINNLNGDLYPVVDGSNIGRTGSNRIGTIYMASTIDYLNDLEFKSGTSSILFNTDGKITTESLTIKGDFKFENNPTDGYFLSSDTLGNVSWRPGKINTNGVTHGFVSMADGGTDVFWGKRLADDIGIPEGHILTSSGTSSNPYGVAFDPNFPNTTGIPSPIYKPIWDIKVPASSNGLVLGSNGSTTEWVSSVTGAHGNDGSIQFSSSGFLDSDNSKLHWDNINKRLGINRNNPEYEIDVDGTVRSTIGLFPDLISTNGTIDSLDTSVGTIDILTSLTVDTTDISIDGIFLKGGTTSNGHVLTSDASGFGTWQPLPTTYPSDGNQYNIQFSDGSGGFGSDNRFSIRNSRINTIGIKSSGHRIVNKRLLDDCVPPSTSYVEVSSTIDDHYVIFDGPQSYEQQQTLSCLTGLVRKVADQYTIRDEDCIDGRILHISNLNGTVTRKVVGRLYREVNDGQLAEIALDVNSHITIMCRGHGVGGRWHVISEGYIGSLF